MVISHNLSAMNALRQFNIIDGRKDKSTEKLSSGLKVNRAADNAAGLSISEKMRRQVRGLARASVNCQEGIGLCQVKDGALNEVHEILNRMSELSVHSANGTLNDSDRVYIQTEMDQLVSQINKIGSDTTFNEIQVFDYANQMGLGNNSRAATNTGYLTDVFQQGNSYHPSANLNFGGINASTVSDMYGKSFTFTCSQACDETFSFKFIDGDGTQNSVVGQNDGNKPHYYTIDIHGETTAKGVLDKVFNYVHDNMPNGRTPDSAGNLLVSHSNRLVRTSDNSFSIVAEYSYATANEAAHAFDNNMNTHSKYAKANCSELAGVIINDFVPVMGIQAGAESGQYIYLTMKQMNGAVLGIDPTDVSTQTAAERAISSIKAAFVEVSNQRSMAGAEQNRLEHAINNLDNTAENTQAAESRIRDTDMASEMMQYSLNNILAQAGQSMITQANQTPQGVLSLLQ